MIKYLYFTETTADYIQYLAKSKDEIHLLDAMPNTKFIILNARANCANEAVGIGDYPSRVKKSLELKKIVCEACDDKQSKICPHSDMLGRIGNLPTDKLQSFVEKSKTAGYEELQSLIMEYLELEHHSPIKHQCNHKTR